MEFESYFIESGGKPIVINGEKIYLYDEIDVSGKQSLTINFESTNSKWRQGIMIMFPKIVAFSIEGSEHSGKRAIFWEDTAPQYVRVSWSEKLKFVKVYNTWEVNGGFHSLHNGAAMKKINRENSLLYLCNDGYPDQDFDDLVFSIAFP